MIACGKGSTRVLSSKSLGDGVDDYSVVIAAVYDHFMAVKSLPSTGFPKALGRSKKGFVRLDLSAPKYSKAFGRTCHVVDIENLVGCVDSSGLLPRDLRADMFREAALAYQRKWVKQADLVYVGCDVSIMFDTALDWSSSCVRCGRGKDGADRALIAVLDLDAVVRSCKVLQIASGDHVFSDLASEARDRGLFVRVVARAGHLSHALRTSCDAIYTLA